MTSDLDIHNMQLEIHYHMDSRYVSNYNGKYLLNENETFHHTLRVELPLKELNQNKDE